MQCQRCHFENIPGQQRCFKCGSILEGEITILDVHPPRMPPWKRPWRRLARHLQPNFKPKAEQPTHPDREPWLDDLPHALAGILWSLIPGLGHVILRRGLHRVSLPLLAWVVDMAMALWQLPAAWGWTALGIGAGIHAWLALDAGLLSQLRRVQQRLAAVSVGFLGFIAVYITLAWLIQPFNPSNPRHLRLARHFFARTSLAVPAEQIHVGDTLRLRTWDPNLPLPRGALVRFPAPTLVRRRRHPIRRTSSGVHIIGEVIGLPQEVVEIRAGRYYVNQIALDPGRYPVPGWLMHNTLAPTQVPVGRFFVSTEYNRSNRALPSQMIRQACLVDSNDIDGLATMLWNPSSRRHRLK